MLSVNAFRIYAELDLVRATIKDSSEHVPLQCPGRGEANQISNNSGAAAPPIAVPKA
jgi:hypothetical protein